MKGVILAGGNGTRLLPLTKVTSKQLLPIYNKPMIYFPINTLKKAGIKDILIVTGRNYAEHFLKTLGKGEEFGLNFSYKIQETAGGIAQALSLAKDFVKEDNVTVILGDNIYEEDFKKDISSFESGSRIFLKQVQKPERFGVAELKEMKVINIEEKPNLPKSNYAVTGLYVYDSDVFKIISSLKPSQRNELEITDVNNKYISKGKMDARFVKGFWSDAGTFDSLYFTSKFIKENSL